MRDTGAQEAVYVWRFAHREGSPQPSAIEAAGGSSGDERVDEVQGCERPGFVEDVDVQPAAGVRVVQLTPAGSECSIDTGTDCRPTTGWHRARPRACSWWRPASSRPALNWSAAGLTSALWGTWAEESSTHGWPTPT